MSTEDDDIELILRYHTGMLDKSEFEVFRNRETVDADFAEKVRSYQEVIEGVQYYGKQEEFANTIRSWEVEIKSQDIHTQQRIKVPPEAKIVSLHSRWYWIAAAVVLILLVSLFFIKGTDDHHELYEAYYKPYPSLFHGNVRGEHQDSTVLAQAFNAYNEQRYEQASSGFRSALSGKNGAEKDNILLYLGNSYLEQDSIKSAIDALQGIRVGSIVWEQATWYLALSYLKQGEEKRAEEKLNELINHGGTYLDKASEILSKLK